MLLIASTRFNTKTWIENQKWREKNNWNGCIYGTPIKIAEKLMPLATMIIIEMHNDENMIKGISLIRNAIMTNKYYKIYSSLFILVILTRPLKSSLFEPSNQYGCSSFSNPGNS